MSTQRPFKVGDKVRWLGEKGVVEQLNMRDSLFPVTVRFHEDHRMSFTLDGRLYTWHKTPSLKHRRFKKRPEKVREVWVNIDEHGDTWTFKDKRAADTHCMSIREVRERAVRFVRAKRQKGGG